MSKLKSALWAAWIAGRIVWKFPDKNVAYAAAVDRYQVPQIAVVVATGREAWRVSNLAAELIFEKSA